VHVELSTVIAIVALAIMIAPTIAGWVRMPGIIGLVLAGTLLGPYVLGILPEGSVDELGKIGLLYLMFQAGLEIDMATFNKYRRAAVIFGLLTFTFPFVAGAAEGYFVLGFSAAAAVLIGSIWASHTLVTLPDVREAGIGTSRVVTTVAGATIITDTLALVILAVVTAEGASPQAVLLKVGAGLVTLALYCFFVLPWLGKRFFRGAGQGRTLRFAFLLFALATAGLLAELFGIEGLVGAFLAGLGVNRLVPHGGPLSEHVDFFGDALFVPAFLVYVGTKLNPAVVIDPNTLMMAGLFLLALLAGKGLAALIGGRALKFSLAESGVMFGMTIPQAAATLAATLVGAEAGLLNAGVVNAVVFVVLASIVIGSVLTRRFAEKVEQPAGTRRPVGSSVLVGLPTHVAPDMLITVATAVAAMNDGLVLPVAVATKDRGDTAQAQQLAEDATRVATAHGKDVESRVRFADSYSEAILEAIVDRRASSLVTPLSTDKGLVSRVFGNELERIGKESPIPVIAVRPGPLPPTKVLLGLDSRAKTPADLNDQALAVGLVEALRKEHDLPLAVSGRSDAAIDALGLPDVDERIVGSRALIAHPEAIVEGSIVVVPASLVRRLGPRALEFANLHPHATLVITAGPYRLRTSLGVSASANLLGVPGGTSAVLDCTDPDADCEPARA